MQPTSKNARPKTRLRRMLALFVLAAMLWCYVVYWCWMLDRRWTAFVLLACVISSVAGYAIAQLRRGANMRGMVIVLPALVAGCCVPLAEVVQCRNLVSKLKASGVSEYSILPHARWQWFAESFGDHFSTRLTSLRVSLDMANLDRLVDLPTNDLEWVTIERSDVEAGFDARIVAWINSIPEDSRYVTVALRSPRSAELENLSGVEVDLQLSLSEIDEPIPALRVPALTHLSISDSDFRFLESTDISMPKLEGFHIVNCRFASDFRALLNLRGARSANAIACTWDKQSLEAFLNLPVRRLRLTEATLPDDLELESFGGEPRGSVMLYSCAASGETILSLANARNLKRLFTNGPTPLSVHEVHALISRPNIEYLILAGDWIRLEHVEAIVEVGRDFTLQIDTPFSSFSRSEEEQLRAKLPTNVMLSVLRSGGGATLNTSLPLVESSNEK